MRDLILSNNFSPDNFTVPDEQMGLWDSVPPEPPDFLDEPPDDEWIPPEPPEGWTPAGWTPPADHGHMIAKTSVTRDQALRTAQFYLLWGVLFINVTAGIGIPILVGLHHGNPAVMAAIGMFCGYCGTLMTPMAANFNIIPAALLELKDRNAVIRAQWPTALMLLGVNIVLLRLFM